MTSAEYAANLIARFGRVPSMQELAKREEAFQRHRDGQPTRWSQYTTTEQMDAIRAARFKQGETTKNAILSTLTRPMTRNDISQATGIALSTVDKALIRLRLAGKVTKIMVKRVGVWERT